MQAWAVWERLFLVVFLEGSPDKSTTGKSPPVGALPCLAWPGSLLSRSRAWVLLLDKPVQVLSLLLLSP